MLAGAAALSRRLYFRSARNKCYLAVNPNPNTSAPTMPLDDNDNPAGAAYYLLKFGDGPRKRVEGYVTSNPDYAFAFNDGQGRQGKEIEKAVLQAVPGVRQYPQHGHKRTEWYQVKDTGKKNAQGQNLRAVIRGILADFPNHDLDDPDSFSTAVASMADRLKEVAEVKEGPPRASFVSGPSQGTGGNS